MPNYHVTSVKKTRFSQGPDQFLSVLAAAMFE